MTHVFKEKKLCETLGWCHGAAQETATGKPHIPYHCASLSVSFSALNPPPCLPARKAGKLSLNT